MPGQDLQYCNLESHHTPRDAKAVKTQSYLALSANVCPIVNIHSALNVFSPYALNAQHRTGDADDVSDVGNR
jgi:hypothetical protein